MVRGLSPLPSGERNRDEFRALPSSAARVGINQELAEHTVSLREIFDPAE